MITLSFCLMLLLSGSVHATVYQYLDKDGKITFTNVPINGAQAILFNPHYSPLTQKKKDKTLGSIISPERHAEKYPTRIDASTQQQRDNSRRKILEQELVNERKALAEAERALADGHRRTGETPRNHPKHLNGIRKLQDEVSDRQNNVKALCRELRY